MPRKKSPASSEVAAYIYIKRNLDLLGWDVRNPARNPSGQVFTQNEVLHDEIVGPLLKGQKPENVVKVTDTTYWVLESKRTHAELEKAVNEAADYADLINESRNVQALFISGVAGNDEDSWLIENQFWNGRRYVPITANGQPLTSLLSPEIIQRVLEEGPDLQDVPIDAEMFLGAAERINGILHDGAVNKNARASVMAALLLAMIEDVPKLDVAPPVLIRDINTRAETALSREGKGEFFQYIKLALPPTVDNHVKFKRALVLTIQELNNLNIRSAMRSGTDVLGKFYEVFLKYGNGAKEIGIVLTPRHVTSFAVEALNVNERDIVYDPTCGTGGFLVAAFDRVQRDSGEEAREWFKEHSIFGVEQDSAVAALAIVNMIFRGDGKTNLREGNCFTYRIVREGQGRHARVRFAKEREEVVPGTPGVTKVLMNPPFKPKTGGGTPEFKFVDHALDQMEDGGLLFSVLPYGEMVKPKAYEQWRRRLLRDHTLLCVLTLPPDLFYPVGVLTVGIIVRKGIPHPPEQNVLWVRSIYDGHLKSKGKRLPVPSMPDDLSATLNDVKAFVATPTYPVANVAMFKKAAPVDYGDKHLELVPENYLDQAPLSVEDVREALDQAIREGIAFLIKMNLYRPGMEGAETPPAPKKAKARGEVKWKDFRLTDLFGVKSGSTHAKKELDPGNVPLISCGDVDQGLVGFYDIEKKKRHKEAVTVAYNGAPLTAKYHPYPFGAKDDVAVLTPLSPMSPAVMQFIAVIISSMRWRYHYGRKCFRGKLMELEIPLPVTPGGEPDTALMEAIVKEAPYWQHIEAAGQDAKLPEVSPLTSLETDLRARTELPYPDTDLSPAAQRTIRRMIEAGEDEGPDVETFLSNLERAAEP